MTSLAYVRVLLTTGRSLAQGMSMEAEGKASSKYMEAAATLRLSPGDLKRLGVKPGSRVRVETRYGSVVVYCKPDPGLPEGLAFIPMGPWANKVVSHETSGVGMPSYKSVEATIYPTEESVPTVHDMLYEASGKLPERYPVDLELRPGDKRVVEDFICPFCGDLCDFLVVHLNGNVVERVVGACPLSLSKIRNYHRDRVVRPYIRDASGRLVEADLERALDKAARILYESKHPVLFGWSSTSNEAMSVGVELAELLGGIVDNTAVMCHGPTTMGVMETGAARATLGVIRHLADLIIFWGCNPAEAHPNHFRRWVFSKGRVVKGRKERKVVVVDVRKTATARLADTFIRVEPGRDYELLTALRMAVKDQDIEARSVAGVPRETIYQLADTMRSARYGVIFVGMGLTMNDPKNRNLEEAIRLAHDLNDWTRFVVIPMRGHFNVTGTNQCMTWLTGYPYAVDFMRGIPKFIPCVTTSTDALINGEVDAALVVASDPVAHMPWAAVRNLLRIPLIVVDPKWSLTAMMADVLIPSAMVGIEAEGTAYRMDGVPIRLKKIVEPPPGVHDDEWILRELLKRVKRLGGG